MRLHATFSLALTAFGLTACSDPAPRAEAAKGEQKGERATSGESPDATETKEAGGDASAESGEAAPAEAGGPGAADTPEAPEAVADAVEVSDPVYPEAGGELEGVSARGEKRLMVHEKVSHEIYALAGKPGVPTWGGGSAPELARDDDVDSAFSCGADAERCVWGLALPEESEVRAIRLFGANPASQKEYKGSPRVARVRVHTELGYTDVDLPDGEDWRWVVFSAPVKTRGVSVEVLDTHGPGAVFTIGEVEVFGQSGQARAPLYFDPSLSWVSFDAAAWGGSKMHGIRRAYLRALDAEGRTRNLGHATAVYSIPKSRYQLLEWLYKTECDAHEVSYTVLDTQTRRAIHVGELGGNVGEVRPASNGLGFLVGGDDVGWSIVEHKEKLTRRKPEKVKGENFEETRLARGGDLEEGEIQPAAGCATVDAASVGADADASWSYLACSLDGDKKVTVGSPGECKGGWSIDVAGATQASGDEETRPVRMRRGSDGRLLVEVSKKAGNASEVWSVAPDGTVTELGSGALAVRAPAECEKCLGGF